MRLKRHAPRKRKSPWIIGPEATSLLLFRGVPLLTLFDVWVCEYGLVDRLVEGLRLEFVELVTAVGLDKFHCVESAVFLAVGELNVLDAVASNFHVCLDFEDDVLTDFLSGLERALDGCHLSFDAGEERFG